jgi:hypothetical protein
VTDWLTPAAVASYGGVDTVNGNTALEDATAGAAAFVEDKRPDLFVGDPAVFTPSARVVLGAKMLAARLYERRGTLLGVAGFVGYEQAASILRYDPDIEQLLQIGRATPFGFGAGPVDEVTA